MTRPEPTAAAARLRALLDELPEGPRAAGRAALDELLAAARGVEDDARVRLHLAAHDLGEPLHTAAGWLELLERRAGGDLDAASREALGQAAAALRRIRALLDGLAQAAPAGAVPEPVAAGGPRRGPA